VPDDRTYIKLHDGMPEHPKVEALNDDAAAWLLVAMWAYSSRNQSDGQVPQVKARRLTKGANAVRCQKLLVAGLIHDGESTCCPPARLGHYYCHDYLKHQRSAEQIAAMKEQRRAAGRTGGQAKGKRGAKQTASEMPSEMASKTRADTEGSSNEEPQTEQTPTRPSAAEPPGFDAFWFAYPRKDSKPHAVKAYRSALKRSDPETLLLAAQRFRDDPRRNPNYTPYAATWLNGDRWNDQPAPFRVTSPLDVREVAVRTDW
jgi:hypothetical protein